MNYMADTMPRMNVRDGNRQTDVGLENIGEDS
jgi:hypothetical protein